MAGRCPSQADALSACHQGGQEARAGRAGSEGHHSLKETPGPDTALQTAPVCLCLPSGPSLGVRATLHPFLLLQEVCLAWSRGASVLLVGDKWLQCPGRLNKPCEENKGIYGAAQGTLGDL